MVVGAMTLVTTALNVDDSTGGALFDRFELSALWFVAAGAFVGLGRIWGELAERTGKS
jgi:hypothetical protein